jgi:pyruvate ferredoxin oxidoreductase beta subunit
MTAHNLRFYQKGTFTLGNRLVSGADPIVPSPTSPPTVLDYGGHANCPGCGVALAARYVADAAARGRVRVRIHSCDDVGELPDIFGRNDDVLCICFDSEDLQSSPDTMARASKSFEIAMMRGIPYVATATVADLRDLQRKLAKALAIGGARAIHIHAPCPALGGTQPQDTVRLARHAAECGFFPVFEAEMGIVTGSRRMRHRVPVSTYLKLQPCFARLGAEDVAKLQGMADRNIMEFGLLPHQDEN